MSKSDQQTMSNEVTAFLFGPHDRINVEYNEQSGFFIHLNDGHEWSHYVANREEYDFEKTTRKDLLMHILLRCKCHTESNKYLHNTNGVNDWDGFPECINMFIAILYYNMDWTGAMLNIGTSRFQNVLGQIMNLPLTVIIPEMRAFIDIMLVQADTIEFDLRYRRR